MAGSLQHKSFKKNIKEISKNKLAIISIIFLFLILFASLFPNFISNYDPTEMNPLVRFSSPSLKHLMGTDQFGRDIWTRVVYGARLSMIVGFCSVAISLIMGIPCGIISGYFGGKIDAIIMRIMDGLLAFPTILLAMVIVGIAGPNLFNLILALSIGRVPRFARLIRSSILSEKEKEYVEAAKAIGKNNLNIAIKTIFPNCFSSVIIYSTLSISYAILNEAALSFLGLGIQPPAPAWGCMLNTGKGFLNSAPWLSIFPGIAIFITVWSFNILGDQLRDMLDPHFQSEKIK